MFTRITQFMLVAVLGGILSVVLFSGTAIAAPVPSFTVTPERAAVGDPITVTSTTSNPEGLDLTYEWAKAGYPNYDVRVGSPECLNAECSQARWTYATPRLYGIELVIKWPGNSEGVGTNKTVTIVAAGEAPAPIYLASPTTVSLPTVIEVRSPKRRMIPWGCQQVPLKGSYRESCKQYLVKRTGPDPEGFFHYRFRLPMAYPGVVELSFLAWNEDRSQADFKTFSVTVTGNAYRFGDVRSCYWPVLRNVENKRTTAPSGHSEHLYDLFFYSEKDVRVTVDFQVRKGDRWVTTRRRQETFSSRLSSDGQVYSPWSRKQVRVRFEPPTSDRRLTYQIKNGRTLLKRGTFSTTRCRVF